MGGDGRTGWRKVEIQTPVAEIEFEYDESKSKANKEKQGIDFETAKTLWKDDKRIRIVSSYKEEPRELIVAKYNDTMHVAVITLRENRIRIISVRRARDYEVTIYDRQENDS
jgi:uncharacterized DUF497 family protein